jgi:hypothetical protein
LCEELEDNFVQLELELLVVYSCLIPRQFFPMGIGIVSFIFFLVVSSCVIQRKICPIEIEIVSCVFLCNTGTNFLNWNWNC